MVGFTHSRINEYVRLPHAVGYPIVNPILPFLMSHPHRCCSAQGKKPEGKEHPMHTSVFLHLLFFLRKTPVPK